MKKRLDGKPEWPYVKAPYLWPSWLIALGLCIQPLGIGQLPLFMGFWAYVYAYRKRHVELSAEKRWWREFNKGNE